MAAGNSGSIKVTLSSYNKGTGYVTFYWREDYDYDTWTSTITIYKVTVYHDTYHGKWQVKANIAVNDTTIGTLSQSTHYGTMTSTGNPAVEVLENGTTSISFTSDAISHSSDGTLSVSLAITSVGLLNNTYGWTVSGKSNSATITLTDLSTIHVHSYTPVITPPTCTEQGYTTYTCECGDSYISDYTDALGHNWDDGVITTEPTYTTDGTIIYTCTRCNITKTEIIPRLGAAKRIVPVVLIAGEEYIPYVYTSSSWHVYHSLVYNGANFDEY